MVPDGFHRLFRLRFRATPCFQPPRAGGCASCSTVFAPPRQDAPKPDGRCGSRECQQFPGTHPVSIQLMSAIPTKIISAANRYPEYRRFSYALMSRLSFCAATDARPAGASDASAFNPHRRNRDVRDRRDENTLPFSAPRRQGEVSRPKRKTNGSD
jgi:hypothetical protein